MLTGFYARSKQGVWVLLNIVIGYQQWKIKTSVSVQKILSGWSLHKTNQTW